jgi:hypothetical protein
MYRWASKDVYTNNLFFSGSPVVFVAAACPVKLRDSSAKTEGLIEPYKLKEKFL